MFCGHYLKKVVHEWFALITIIYNIAALQFLWPHSAGHKLTLEGFMKRILKLFIEMHFSNQI